MALRAQRPEHNCSHQKTSAIFKPNGGKKDATTQQKKKTTAEVRES